MVKTSFFGEGYGDIKATLYTIENADGSSVSICDFGGKIQSIKIPDKNGVIRNMTLGFDSVMQYMTMPTFYGATIGRVGNRIGGAAFDVGGKHYEVAVNNGPNHLHGGVLGFDKRMWKGEILGEDSVRISRLSPDGEEGYPGNLEVSITFTFDASRKLTLHYEATTDADTLCNLTNHSYFNLNGTHGRDTGTILNHTLWIDADRITACDPNLLPNGDFIDVTGTPFDFRTPKTIGRDIDADNEFIGYAHGYDFNYCLNGSGFRKVAEATGDESGITMECWTDLPGMQLYTSRRESFCLETQAYPNANQHPEFPTIVLKKGEKYDTTTVYQFK